MLEECHSCKQNYLPWSNKCTKKTEAAKVTCYSRKMGLAGRAPTSETMDKATGTNKVVLGPRLRGMVAEVPGGVGSR